MKHNINVRIAFIVCGFWAIAVSNAALAVKNMLVESAEDRVALVIGNKDYAQAPLKNPVNDARDMKAALQRLGFRVIYRENADRPAMDSAAHEFIASLNENSIGVFYYSGHGAQADGSNYLIPVRTDIASKAELKARAYDAGIILDEMQEAGNPVNIIILDACRNNPFKGFRGGADGLATMSGPKGSLIAFATAPGSVAQDNPSERNGTYTKYLKRYITEPGLKIQDMLMQVRKAVTDENPDQVPWENSSMIGDFCFAGCAEGAAPIAKVVEDEPPPAPNPPTPTPKACDYCPEMVRLPQLGIAIGKYEVTQGQWRRLMGNNPSNFQDCGDDCPVEQVNYEDIQRYVERLSERTGKRYRLPTEGEWYRACQSGQTWIASSKYACGADSEGLDAVSWNRANSNNRTHPVGKTRPNAWGIYDMTGNVWELTSTCWKGDCNMRELRGGSWSDGVSDWFDIKSPLYSSNHFGIDADERSSNIGFRLVQDL